MPGKKHLRGVSDKEQETIDKIAAAQRRIAELEGQIAALDAKIAEEQLELRKTKAEYATFVRSAYKSNADPLAQLLAAPDFQGFLNRAVAIEHLTYLANRLIDHIHQVDLQLHTRLFCQCTSAFDDALLARLTTETNPAWERDAGSVPDSALDPVLALGWAAPGVAEFSGLAHDATRRRSTRR